MGTTDERLPSLLRNLRISARLTQEELAEHAGISARTISDVERGLRDSVHRDTATRLATALGLEGEQGRRFEAIARGRTAHSPQIHRESTLPAVPTPFLGRQLELDGIKAALTSGQIRLLTLTGPGGIGKTRLAVEAARTIDDLFPDGTFFVSLGDVREASLVAPELAKALGVAETGGDFEQLLTDRLRGRRALVVLDTFEHLTPASPLVYALLLGCTETTFLVTSRSALRLRGEHEFPVPPLDSPAAGDVQSTDVITRSPATALFWDRARAVRPDMQLDRQMASLVVEICRRLDGLPLAIELAAARVKHLTLDDIRRQLDRRLDLLVGGPRDLPQRQRAIRDTVAWSHDLLDAPAQILFRRLSVFTGGWSLHDANGNCGPFAEGGGALSGISDLVDQSLVIVHQDRLQARYDMLDVVKEYAAQRLIDAGESEERARRHALYFLEVAEEAEPNLTRAGHQHWFQRLDMARSNMRAGISWVIAQGETTLALRYTVALWRYWRHLGDFAEGRRWLDAALAMPGSTSAELRAKALWAAGALAFPQGDTGRMAVLAAEAYELAQQSKDRMDLRNALTITGMVAMMRGQYVEAIEPFRTAVAICLELGTTWHLGTSYLNLGTALLHAGFDDEAMTALRDGGRIYRVIGDDVFAARIDNTMAHVSLARGEVAEAERLARGALITASAQHERQGIGDGIYTLSATAAARCKTERAATLAGAADAVRKTIAARPGLFDVAIPAEFLESAEESVPPAAWSRWWQAGHHLTLEEAVDYALDEN